MRPNAISCNATPNVLRLLPISAQVSSPNCDKTSYNICIAYAATIKPAALNAESLGMKFKATVIAAIAAAIPTKPLAIPLQLITANSPIAEANIFIEVAKRTKAAPANISPESLDTYFENIVNSASKAPIATKPLAIPFQLTLANLETASDNTTIAEANKRMPNAEAVIPTLNFAYFINKKSSAIRTPIPTRPLAIPFQLKLAKFFIAADNINIAVDMAIIKGIAFNAPLNDPPILLNKAIPANSSINSTVIAPRALPN